MILVPLLADFTTLKGFLNLIRLDFDIVSDFDIRMSSLCYINSTNSYVRIYKQIMQNKPNFENDKMNITLDMTSNYKVLSAGSGQKTKPIQSQFKANLSQNKPNSNPIKANTNPIASRSGCPQAYEKTLNLRII
ncbi:MAG: hypothetical protein H8D56_24440 [Planctomycetes bacterium]|nr:hypothetical protein [Planctomycetota bacterium]